MKNKLLLLLLLFMFGSLVFVMQKSDRIHELDILSYENRLIQVENRYLAEKEKHEETKLELAYTKRILSDKDKLMQEFVTSQCVGEFEITYYTAGYESTRKDENHPLYGITRSGEPVLEGYTVAADWDVLPIGSKVFIEGIGFRTVTDSGGDINGNRLDIFVEDVNVAREYGRHTARVYVLE